MINRINKKECLILAALLILCFAVMSVGAVSADELNDTQNLTQNTTSNQTQAVNQSVTETKNLTVRGYWIRGDTALGMSAANWDALKNAGVTDVFVSSSRFSSSYYYTKVLGMVLPYAHTRGIKVHAWVVCFKDASGGWVDPQGLKSSKVSVPYKKYWYKGWYKVRRSILSGKSIYLSAAVMPDEVILSNGAGKYYGQSYDELADYVDFLVPMTYKGNYNTNTQWIGSKIAHIKHLANDKNGNSIPVLAGLQNYRGDGNLHLLSAAEVSADAAYAMAYGASGYVVFRYGIAKYVTYKVRVAYKKVKYRAWVKKAYKVKKWVKRHGKWVRKYVTKYKWKKVWKTKWLYTYRTYGKYVLT